MFKYEISFYELNILNSKFLHTLLSWYMNSASLLDAHSCWHFLLPHFTCPAFRFLLSCFQISILLLSDFMDKLLSDVKFPALRSFRFHCSCLQISHFLLSFLLNWGLSFCPCLRVFNVYFCVRGFPPKSEQIYGSGKVILWKSNPKVFCNFEKSKFDQTLMKLWFWKIKVWSTLDETQTVFLQELVSFSHKPIFLELKYGLPIPKPLNTCLVAILFFLLVWRQTGGCQLWPEEDLLTRPADAVASLSMVAMKISTWAHKSKFNGYLDVPLWEIPM